MLKVSKVDGVSIRQAQFTTCKNLLLSDLSKFPINLNRILGYSIQTQTTSNINLRSAKTQTLIRLLFKDLWTITRRAEK